jgi:serine/alanine racemase
MKTESLGGFDRFRVPAALLVIAIHTGPLLSLNGEANYLLTDILARIAVPFFFSVSGWFLVPRLLREGRAALIPFVKKLLLLYGAAVLLYLPLNLYNHTLEESGFALLRDVLFNGTFYHLWYFPALVLGACLVYGLLRILGPRWAWLPALLLYAAGLLGDSYFGLTAALPPLRAGYEALFLLFDYTRNGLFFPPVFLLLGGWLALRPARRSAAWYGAGLLLSLALLTAEGLLVQRLALARFDALYLSLPLCVGFLLRWLQRLSLPSAPALRDWAAAVYVLHPGASSSSGAAPGWWASPACWWTTVLYTIWPWSCSPPFWPSPSPASAPPPPPGAGPGSSWTPPPCGTIWPPWAPFCRRGPALCR